MSRLKIKTDAFELLGSMLDPPPAPPPVDNQTWSPRLTPSQQILFDSDALYILCWGEKGGAKTYGCLSKMVKHCYENRNALGLVLVKVKSMANKGGALDKLMYEVLPDWKNGLGLHHSDIKQDTQHNEFVWIQNQYGGWSMIVFASAPHAYQLRERIRGYEPSIVFVDELTSTDSDLYFTAVAAQLGRRPLVEGKQQYLGACNPEGESHWVYKKWFEEPFDEDTELWDPDFEKIHFLIEENRANLQAGYLESLAKIYRNDPTESARMIEGVWRDKPSGEGIFVGFFDPTRHMYPLDEELRPKKDEFIIPHTDYPMIIGLDPGSVYNTFIFEQRLPLDGRLKWVFFDEIVILKRQIKYADLVPLVMRRIVWWRKTVGFEVPQVWISDDNAFNVYRASTGSFDVLTIERIYEANREKYGLEKMRVRKCPKFNGSVKARVTTARNCLAQDEAIVSSKCLHMKRMFEQLRSTPQKSGQPYDPDLADMPMRSDHLHVFDGATYPMLAASIAPILLQPPSREGTQRLISVAA